jgi:transposase
MREAEFDRRGQDGLAIFRDYSDKIREVVPGKYTVPSQRGPGAYFVDPSAGTCSCPDQQETRRRCKHAWAVLFLRGDVEVPAEATGAPKRPTRKRNFRAMYAASAEEKSRAQLLLRGLCDGVQQPPYKGNGRPALSLGDLIYALVVTIFCGDSIRRAGSDIDACHALGLLEDVPSAGSLFRAMERPDLTPLLQVMIAESAAPLVAFETEQQYAADSTGFSTDVCHSYCDYRHGGKMRPTRTFVKAHVIVGTCTHVVTWAEPTTGNVSDMTKLPKLVQEMVARYPVRELSADAGYCSKANAELIASVGAVPYICFKENTTGQSGPKAWMKMWHDFSANTEEYLQHYHRRSNVETVFGMVKAKFGERLRARTQTAMFNEMLLKFLSHNLSCLVRAIHELGIAPKFDRIFSLTQPATAGAPP